MNPEPTSRPSCLVRFAPFLLVVLMGCVGVMLAANFVLVGAWLTWRTAEPVAPVAVVLTPTAVPQGLSILRQAPTPAGVTVPETSETTEFDGNDAPSPVPTASPTAVGESILANLAQQYDLPVPPEIDQRPIPADGREMLNRLLAVSPPARDYHETAIRLGNTKPRSRTLPLTVVYDVGDQRTFYATDGPITATVAAVGDYAYFWLEEGIAYEVDEITAVVERFDQELYPQTTRLFGTEWNPGIDGDPRFHILHLAYADGDELGYFDSINQYPRAVFDQSNEAELIHLNLAELRLGNDLYYGTLVHELQHLTQWHIDPNEETWLDEGLSQLTEHLAGFDTFDVSDYLNAPSLPLTQWGVVDVYAHYGASALFMIYFYEQLGEQAVYDLAHHPANGMASVAAVLALHQPERSLEQFLGDWAVANFVRDSGWGRSYAYEYQFRLPRHDQRITAVPFSETHELPQYGVRYIELPAGEYQLSFAGDTLVDLADAPPTGRQVWLAPAADNAESHLTKRFDLRQIPTATLTFDIWYDLEEDYDFAYLLVSNDNGQTWQLLDPGPLAEWGSYGLGLTGQSEGWQPLEIPLDAFTGQEILFRWAMLSDGGIMERGVAVDNIALPELGYLDTVEQEVALPQESIAAGFAPLATSVPQNWSVQLLVYEGSHGRVESLPLDGRNQGQWSLNLPEGGTLVIMPQAPLTQDTAVYWLALD